MSNSLLAHIASSFISQYENVANSSVAYLLNTYPPARAALGRMVQRADMPFRYVTELGTGENGRPDVTGINEAGDKLVIIEGKFWANLTPNQPANYLSELAPEGKLVFLAPERRRLSLSIELERRQGHKELSTQVLVFSWNQFIDAIESENARNPQFALASDLVQLKALCDRMDVEGMPPLSQSDLDPMNGRIAYQMADLLDECRELLRQWEPVDLKAVRATAWKLGYGFYFRAYGLGCQLFFSSYQWFTCKAGTPFWLTIGDEKFKRSESILNTLAHWDPENTYDDQPIAAYAIHIRPGLDRREVVETIVNSAKAALDAVAQSITRNGADT